ncbi:MAG: VWA domain-containing protein, partial [Myxococcales bacterium]|nr:VWA domain-containing protein [Myxococcales bacterium]
MKAKTRTGARLRGLGGWTLAALLAAGCSGDDGASSASGTSTTGTTADTTTTTAGSASATEGTSTTTEGSGSASASEGTSTTTTTTSASATATMGTTTMGATAGESESESDTDVCADADVTFEPQIPTVMLLIDQSGSMTSGFGGTNRWDAVYDALLNAQDGIVLTLQEEVRFALGLYTSFNGNDGGECPVITEVPPDLSNYAAIEAVYAANQPEDETPTGESILAVMDTLLNDPAPGDKVIVLATDGEPDTCAEPNPQNGQGVAVAAAETAFSEGIRTYVISVGNQVSDQHLQDMANAGAGVMQGDPDAPFYKANDKDALVAAFQEIINGVRDCKLTLDGVVQEGFEDQCVVTVNGDA